MSSEPERTRLGLLELVPPVLRKRDGKILRETFDVKYILESLKKETTLNDSEIQFIVKKFFQFLIPRKYKYVTAPMIREILCNIMLEHGFERSRFEYTRIGLPYADMKEIKSTNMEDHDQRVEIYERVEFEYNEIKKILEEKK